MDKNVVYHFRCGCHSHYHVWAEIKYIYTKATCRQVRLCPNHPFDGGQIEFITVKCVDCSTEFNLNHSQYKRGCQQRCRACKAKLQQWRSNNYHRTRIGKELTNYADWLEEKEEDEDEFKTPEEKEYETARMKIRQIICAGYPWPLPPMPTIDRLLSCN